jgi:CRISPR system Cascade subunit CasE
MMLSRLFLNAHSRDVQRALGDSHALHARVMSMYPRVDAASPRAALGVLHRLEHGERGDALVLLVQSSERPDVTKLPAGFLDPRAGGDAASSKDLAPVLSAMVNGARFRFRLRANATRKIDTKSGSDGKRRNGKRVPVRGEDGRLQWITSRLHANGFTLLGECQQRPEGKSLAQAGGKVRTHEAHVFDGVVEVVDGDLARHAVTCGIGPAKAYGFGLLSLARV